MEALGILPARAFFREGLNSEFLKIATNYTDSHCITRSVLHTILKARRAKCVVKVTVSCETGTFTPKTETLKARFITVVLYFSDTLICFDFGDPDGARTHDL